MTIHPPRLLIDDVCVSMYVCMYLERFHNANTDANDEKGVDTEVRVLVSRTAVKKSVCLKQTKVTLAVRG